MNASPITAVPSDISGSSTPPPSTSASVPRFADLLASSASALAAFALLPMVGSDSLSGSANAPPPPRRKDDTSNNGAAIALPAPVQTPAPAAPAAGSNGADTASPSVPQPQSTSAVSNQQQTPSSAQTPAAGSGSAGTGGTSSGGASSTGGTALPPIAAELGTRIALGAQALVSQPSQALATLPHGALQAASTPAPAPNLAAAAQTAHGGTAPDPGAILAKPVTTSSLAATPGGATAPAFESTTQPVAPQTSAPVAASISELAILSSASDTTAQSGADPASTAAPSAVLTPLPAAGAASTIETPPPPVIAASALDQVAASLRQTTKVGLNQIEIQLKPASLGAVDVRLELTHDGRVTAVISADRSDTLLQLERGAGELQQALKDAGLQTDSGSLSFTLRGDPQTSDQSGRQPAYALPQAGTGVSDDLLPVIPGAAGASPSAHNGLLNIQV